MCIICGRIAYFYLSKLLWRYIIFSQPSVCLLSSFGFIQPTNHLDIPAKQMLEEALQNFQGSVVVISHDRYFISRVANRIVEIRDGELVIYRGNYAYYQDKKAEEKAETEAKRLMAEKEAKRKANNAKQKERASRKKNAA